MPSRSTTTDKLLRTPFRSRARTSSSKVTAQSEERVARLAERARPVDPFPPATDPAGPAVGGETQCELGEATYQCGCGFVFQSPVLTSVDCPHCGDSQAW